MCTVCQSIGHLCLLDRGHVIKLVHGVVFSSCFQSTISGEVFLVVISNIGASHVLMLDTVETLSNFSPLNSLDISQHCLWAEVSIRNHVRHNFNAEYQYKMTFNSVQKTYKKPIRNWFSKCTLNKIKMNVISTFRQTRTIYIIRSMLL